MSKIFLVKDSFLADKKVYFVKEDYLADEKVLIVKDLFLADYKAFEVDYSYLADVKVYDVKYSALYPSDLSGGGSHSGFKSEEDRIIFLRNKIDRQSREIDAIMENSTAKIGCWGKNLIRLIFFAMLGLIFTLIFKFFGIGEDDPIQTNYPKGYMINTKGLNLRATPGTSGEIIKLMNQNDSIWQLNDSSQDIGSDTWIYVTDKVDTGWVNEIFTK